MFGYMEVTVAEQLGPESRPSEESPNEIQIQGRTEDGYSVGDFRLRPKIALASGYDSNIFATRTNEVEDSFWVLAPSLAGTSVWKTHEFKFDVGGSVGRYQDNDAEDYEDYWANLRGRYDLSKKTNVFGGFGYSFEHEDRGSPEDELAGDEPTTFDSLRLHAGVAHSFGKASIRVGGTFEQLDFDNVAPLNNDDRNRDLSGLGARVRYRIDSQYGLYLQGIRDLRDYESRVDDAGFARSSDGYRVALGLQVKPSNRLSGELFGGLLRQDYDDSRFSTVSVADFGGSVKWRTAPRTTLSAKLERSLEETTVFGASSYLNTSLSGQVKHWVAPRLTLNAGLAIAEADYQDIDREDDYRSAQLGLRYYLTPRWYVAAEYRVQARDSSLEQIVNTDANPQSLEDYSRNQLFLTLGTLVYSVERPAYWDMATGESLAVQATSWSGYYAGVQVGHQTLNADTDGVRGPGIDLGEFSGAGGMFGLFGGYGRDFGRWYLGAELEAETSEADLFHRKAKDSSRTFSFGREDAYGLALRGGYRLASGTLVYGRLGAVRADFDTFYTINDEPFNAFNREQSETGLRYGLGADIPAGEHLFLRMDYSYTTYDDFAADIVTEAEGIEPSEDLFRLGLGWRFGGIGAKVAPSVHSFTGLYAGAAVGHGALRSDATGVHNDGGGGGGSSTSDFVGDFGADPGVTGTVFVGYGQVFQRWYLGLEAELEDSTNEWTHVRAPTGRNFSVAKQDNAGIGIRAGYVLPRDTLLYARAGHVRGRFNTRWVKGNNRVNDVDRDDRVSGTRYGIGAELPLTKSGFLRLEYSYTDYDSYGFTTSHGNADTMSFDNDETQFRVGIGSRF